MRESIISFLANDKEIEFAVLHNIYSESTIEDAFDNWINRTNEFTCESFCEYVKSKGFKCKPA